MSTRQLRILKNVTLTLLFATLSSPAIAYAAGGEAKAPAAAAEAIDKPKIPVEFICEVDVYYTWQRVLSPTISRGGGNGGGDAKQRVSKPMEVFFVRVGERGAVEVDVKNRLLARLSSVEGSALDHCEKEHQAQSLCVTQKLKSLSGDYRSMDYTARRAILDAVIDDCSRNAGICTVTRTGPIACFENRPPDLPLEEKHSEEAPAAGHKAEPKKK